MAKKFSFNDIKEMEDFDKYIYKVKEGDSKRTYFQFKVTPLNVDDLKIV